MLHFRSSDIDIAYRDVGAGEPILLIHGFASNSAVNWVSTSWTETLTNAGRRTIAMDVRGHGASGKLYDPADYRPALMAADAVNLLDHLGISTADVMGYSMGARIAVVAALAHPEKVRSLVVGGLGWNLVAGMGDEEEIARALEADGNEAVVDAVGLGYRAFAQRTGSDLKALAACMRGQRVAIAARRLGAVSVPVLVAVGSEDRVAGSGERLAEAFAHGRALTIPGRDHMLATGDRVFKAGVLDFLRHR